MTIDVSQFLGVFYAESFERLDEMEVRLQRMTLQSVDAETLDGVFRAVHSIKGGSATFGLPEIADFTQPMVALLRECRAGSREFTTESRDTLLAALECLRGMLVSKQSGKSFDQQTAAMHRQRLHQLLAPTQNEPVSRTQAASTTGQRHAECDWRVAFRPAGHALISGNDPLELLRGLQLPDGARITVDLLKLPQLNELDTRRCYLNWQLQLQGASGHMTIAALLSQIKEECELHVRRNSRSAKPALQEIPSAVGSLIPAGGQSAAQVGGDDDLPLPVSMGEIDSLLSKGGELVVAQSMLNQFGEELVGNALRAMRVINTSSRKIADIIGLIDEISLRTSLLALNTNMEAARTGEPSRGVAAVATEVRNLAHRSATAAQEIRELIRASVQNAATGAKFVKDSAAHTARYVGTALAMDGNNQVSMLHEPVMPQFHAASALSSHDLAVPQSCDLGKQLTLANIEIIHRWFKDLLQVEGGIAFQGGELVEIDTAGLQCLCALFRDRAAANRTNAWVGVSQQLRESLRVAGCEQLLHSAHSREQLR